MAEDAPKSAPLGFLALFTLGLNGIVGVGIFFAPREVSALVPGSWGVSVYLATTLCLLPIAGVYAVLGSRFAEDGGPYVWARAAFGPGLAFFVGWIAWVGAVLSTAAVLVGLAGVLAPYLPLQAQAGRSVLGLGIVAGFALLVARGLRVSSMTWGVLTVLKLVPLLALVFAFVLSRAPSAEATEVSAGANVDSFARAMLICVFATQGFEIVAVPAGHARPSRWLLSAATLGALVAAGLLYCLLHAACLAVPQLALTASPLPAAAAVHSGPALERGVSLTTVISALGIGFGMMAMTPRYLATMGRSDSLGTWLSRESKSAVPLRALGVSVVCVGVLVLGPGLERLFVMSAVAVVAQYSMSALSLLVLGLRRQRGLRPAHAWLTVGSLLAVALVAQATTTLELLAAAGALSVGAVVWMLRPKPAQSTE